MKSQCIQSLFLRLRSLTAEKHTASDALQAAAFAQNESDMGDNDASSS